MKLNKTTISSFTQTENIEFNFLYNFQLNLEKIKYDLKKTNPDECEDTKRVEIFFIDTHGNIFKQKIFIS